MIVDYINRLKGKPFKTRLVFEILIYVGTIAFIVLVAYMARVPFDDGMHLIAPK